MTDRVSPAFAHRHNQDGTWDSICPKCFFIVATEKTEKGLLPHEQNHDCEVLIKAKRRAGVLEPLRYREWAAA